MRKKIVLVMILAMILATVSSCGKKDLPAKQIELNESPNNEKSSKVNKERFEGKLSFKFISETGDEDFVQIQYIKGDNIRNEVIKKDASYVTFYSKADKAIYTFDKLSECYFKNEDIAPESGREVLCAHEWYAKMYYDMATDKNIKLNVTRNNEMYLGEPVIYLQTNIKSIGVDEVKLWYSEKYNLFLKLETRQGNVISGFAVTEISKESVDNKKFEVPSHIKRCD